MKHQTVQTGGLGGRVVTYLTFMILLTSINYQPQSQYCLGARASSASMARRPCLPPFPFPSLPSEVEPLKSS